MRSLIVQIPEDQQQALNSIITSYCIYIQQVKTLSIQVIQSRLAQLAIDSAEQALVDFAAVDGISVAIKKRRLDDIKDRDLPLIAEDKQGHWFLLFKKSAQQYLIKRVDQELPEQFNHDEITHIWNGRVALLTSKNRSDRFFRHFDIRWFIPEIMRFKTLLPELVTSSVCLQLMALMIPLFFQVIMDKVIVNQATDTLNLIVWVMAGIVVMECLVQCSRHYMATHTANRIDARLGEKLYHHLVTLPLGYFQTRSVGVTVMRVTQLNTIREFITGAANTLVLDLAFLFVFLIVMYCYSPLLTGIVLLSIPCCFCVAFLLTPRLQQYLQDLYHNSAINSAFLTESLSSVETIKSQAIEPHMIQQFEGQTRDMVHANFKVSRLMQLQDHLVQLIQKLTLALVIWLGATKVINFELSIGQLIAFNMMAQHALQPITRLTQLWRQFIQTRVSLLQIGDILNTPNETDKDTNALPDLLGDIRVENICFRYDLASALVLNDLSLDIKQGQSVAIIGQSGSGKSTLVKLLQKLFIAEAGRITIAGHDIAQLPALALREHIGVVLQENFLFNKTVRDNIALADPSASLSQIIVAARLAGAHDFIVSLDDGYDTVIAEGGMSLSGGQRQRIAIARALLVNPAILILDEATSALDEVSQAALQAQMTRIKQGRTVIVVAHRLSTVRDCDKIVVLKDGQVCESGTHDNLMADTTSHYANLWHYQMGSKGNDDDRQG